VVNLPTGVEPSNFPERKALYPLKRQRKFQNIFVREDLLFMI
jgi:hypothetical protein